MKTEFKGIVVIVALVLVGLWVFVFWRRSEEVWSRENRVRVVVAEKGVAAAARAVGGSDEREEEVGAPGDSPTLLAFVGDPGRGAVRVMPGKTLASGYFELEDDCYGMWLVRPEKGPDGKVELKGRIVTLTEGNVQELTLQGAFLRSLSEGNRYAAISPGELKPFLKALQGVRADVSMEINVGTSLGDTTPSVSMILQRGETITLHLDPQAVPGGEGVDLELEYRRHATKER